MARILDASALGEVIRKERKRQKRTQIELAALAGVGVRFLRELEYGKGSCQLGLSLKVLHALGISIDAASPEQ